ncbi:Lrp/AsnC ligand binding domain-containing protein [candidate division WOR-3 bacterium]|nr:Lrp/AsnC ligand binding domain-containing protein [candidate division WOR-3 bacterium]
MVTAIILINAERESINELAQKLSKIKGISEVYSISGRFDLAAIIRVSDNEKLADLVTKQMLKMEGIIKTETMIAFRSYSRHDLERMFTIGFKEE